MVLRASWLVVCGNAVVVYNDRTGSRGVRTLFAAILTSWVVVDSLAVAAGHGAAGSVRHRVG